VEFTMSRVAQFEFAIEFAIEFAFEVEVAFPIEAEF